MVRPQHERCYRSHRPNNIENCVEIKAHLKTEFCGLRLEIRDFEGYEVFENWLKFEWLTCKLNELCAALTGSELRALSNKTYEALFSTFPKTFSAAFVIVVSSRLETVFPKFELSSCLISSSIFRISSQKKNNEFLASGRLEAFALELFYRNGIFLLGRL